MIFELRHHRNAPLPARLTGNPLITRNRTSALSSNFPSRDLWGHRPATWLCSRVTEAEVARQRANQVDGMRGKRPTGYGFFLNKPAPRSLPIVPSRTCRKVRLVSSDSTSRGLFSTGIDESETPAKPGKAEGLICEPLKAVGASRQRAVLTHFGPQFVNFQRVSTTLREAPEGAVRK